MSCLYPQRRRHRWTALFAAFCFVTSPFQELSIRLTCTQLPASTCTTASSSISRRCTTGNSSSSSSCSSCSSCSCICSSICSSICSCSSSCCCSSPATTSRWEFNPLEYVPVEWSRWIIGASLSSASWSCPTSVAPSSACGRVARGPLLLVSAKQTVSKTTKKKKMSAADRARNRAAKHRAGAAGVSSATSTSTSTAEESTKSRGNRPMSSRNRQRRKAIEAPDVDADRPRVEDRTSTASDAGSSTANAQRTSNMSKQSEAANGPWGRTSGDNDVLARLKSRLQQHLESADSDTNAATRTASPVAAAEATATRSRKSIKRTMTAAGSVVEGVGMSDAANQQHQPNGCWAPKDFRVFKEQCARDKNRVLHLETKLEELQAKLKQRNDAFRTLQAEYKEQGRRLSSIQKEHSIKQGEAVALASANTRLKSEATSLAAVHEEHRSCFVSEEGASRRLADVEESLVLCSTNLEMATRLANDSSVALEKAKAEATRLVVELQSAEAAGKAAFQDATRHEKRARQLENQLKAIDRAHHDTRTELNLQRKGMEKRKTQLRSINASLRACEETREEQLELCSAVRANMDNCTVMLSAALSRANSISIAQSKGEEQEWTHRNQTIEECFLIKEQCRDNMTQWQKDLSVCEATADRCKKEEGVWKIWSRQLSKQLRECNGELALQNQLTDRLETEFASRKECLYESVGRSLPFSSSCRQLDAFFGQLASLLQDHHQLENITLASTNSNTTPVHGVNSSVLLNNESSLPQLHVLRSGSFSGAALARTLQEEWRKLVLDRNVKEKELRHLRVTIAQLLAPVVAGAGE